MAQGHFTGVAIVIDDECKHSDKAINKITDAIIANGGYVVGMETLPPKGTNYRNFSGASFFILDWNLQGVATAIDGGGGETVPLPTQLAEELLTEKVEFLTQLRNTRLAPVFIFTAEPVHQVKKALRKHKDIYTDDEKSHIFIMSKDDVIEKGVFKVLNDWVEKHPSALALKLWEQQYEVAKNDVFLDFYNRDPLWPAILWRTFEKDGVPPSDELGRVISRNLISRMLPITIDMTAFDDTLQAEYEKDPEAYRKTLLGVLEGERFVTKPHADSIAPGDIFKYEKAYWINIRPDCDCIVRGSDPVTLYLLRGEKLSTGEIRKRMPKPAKGIFVERDDEALVFAMCGGQTVSFELKTLYQKDWNTIAPDRIGRLLPPFSTRVQQRYASYLQRPGLPRMPLEAMPEAIRKEVEETLVANKTAESTQGKHLAEASKKAARVVAPASVAPKMGTTKKATVKKAPVKKAATRRSRTLP